MYSDFDSVRKAPLVLQPFLDKLFSCEDVDTDWTVEIGVEWGGYKFREVKGTEFCAATSGDIDTNCPPDCEQDDRLLMWGKDWDSVLEEECENHVDYSKYHVESCDPCGGGEEEATVYAWVLKEDFWNMLPTLSFFVSAREEGEPAGAE